MHRAHRRTAPTSLVIWLAVLVVAGAGDLRASPDRALIEVRFQQSAPSFSAFRDEHWEALGEAAEGRFAERAGRAYGFLDWSSVPGESDTVLWIISLEEEEQTLTLESGPIKISRILLHHFAEIEGQRFALSQTGDREVLYQWGAVLPAQNPKSLEDAVLDHLDLQLDTLLQDWEIKAVLANIPITDSMIADSDNQRFIVPLRMQELRAMPNSVLNVVFLVQETDEGRLELEPAGTVTEDGPHKDFVKGRIRDFVFRDVVFNIGGNPWWQEPIAAAVLQALDVKIYMIDYKPSLSSIPTTEEGIATEPGLLENDVLENDV